MTITYAKALAILESTAREFAPAFRSASERIPTILALGRIASADVYSPTQTPAADTSAMDGYAVASASTLSACVERPVLLRVVGMVAAGDEKVRPVPQTVNDDDDDNDNDLLSKDIAFNGAAISAIAPCVEIMTGARFPPPFTHNGHSWTLDACLRVEDATPVPSLSPSQPRLIALSKPVGACAHRRRAGEDFTRGDLVVRRGQAVRPQHVMALSSLGVGEVVVYRRLKVGILSTGEEVVSSSDSSDSSIIHDHQIRDANAPFLATALASLGVDVRFWGRVGDDGDRFVDVVDAQLRNESVDVVVSTGAVSMGRYDFVESALAKLGGDGGGGGEALFHRVRVRPGHPVLFGLFPRRRRGGDDDGDTGRSSLNPQRQQQTAFFGLPGNPMACVACLRFFVIPYLRYLHDSPLEERVPRRVWVPEDQSTTPTTTNDKPTCVPTSPLDVFLLGSSQPRHGCAGEGVAGVRLIPAQGSHKVKPLLEADCWVIVGAGSTVDVGGGALLDSLPLYPSSLGLG